MCQTMELYRDFGGLRGGRGPNVVLEGVRATFVGGAMLMIRRDR